VLSSLISIYLNQISELGRVVISQRKLFVLKSQEIALALLAAWKKLILHLSLTNSI